MFTMSVNNTLPIAVLVLSLIGLGGVAGHGQSATNAAAAISTAARSGTYERYVCTGCGLQKSIEVSQARAEAAHQEASFHPTAVSRAIGTNGCQHSWLVYACGRIDGGEYIMSNLPGGKAPTFCLYALISSPDFSSELAAMELPHEKWRLLVTALSTNRALDRSLDEWSTATPRRSYTAWWQQSPLARTNKP
jgi:hypothetical protein